MSKSVSADVVELVPWSDTITAYDEAHFALYLQLLDIRATGASDDTLCRTVLMVEPDSRGKTLLAAYLRRAEWMTNQGYKQLLRD